MQASSPTYFAIWLFYRNGDFILRDDVGIVPYIVLYDMIICVQRKSILNANTVRRLKFIVGVDAHIDPF